MPSPSTVKKMVRGEVTKAMGYSTTELGFIDGVTAGTPAASKALVLGADGLINGTGVPGLTGSLAGATITVGAEAADVINVAIQLEDADGTALATRASCLAYFSDDANGDAAMTTGHSTAPAIGTDGLIQPIIAKKLFLLTSEADGDIDIDCTEAGALTTYLILVMPNGTLVASDAITHAA